MAKSKAKKKPLTKKTRVILEKEITASKKKESLRIKSIVNRDEKKQLSDPKSDIRNTDYWACRPA